MIDVVYKLNELNQQLQRYDENIFKTQNKTKVLNQKYCTGKGEMKHLSFLTVSDYIVIISLLLKESIMGSYSFAKI